MWPQGAVGLVGGRKGAGSRGSGAGSAVRDMVGAAAAGAWVALGCALARLLGTRPRQRLVSPPKLTGGPALLQADVAGDFAHRHVKVGVTHR